VYVGGLPSDIKESEIKREFSKFGKIHDINIKARYAFIVSTRLKHMMRRIINKILNN
jgi:RNA recognition motif-containing protein